MQKANEFTAVASALKSNSSFLIFAHNNPDGDAVGSSVALGLILKKMGKTVDYALYGCEERIGRSLEECRLFSVKYEKQYDCAVILDSSTPEYTKNNSEFKRCRKMIVIDHHLTNPGYGDYNIVRPEAAACAEIVFDLMEYMKSEPDDEIAKAIFLGIWEDTGGFAFSNTTADTHRIASRLYEINSELNTMIDTLQTYDVEKLNLKKVALDNMEISEGGKIVTLPLLYDKGYYPLRNADTTALIDLARYVEGCLLAVMIKQNAKDTYKVSLRSNSDLIDVAEIAIRYGGGGHTKASGFSYSGDYQDLTIVIRSYFREKWTE